MSFYINNVCSKKSYNSLITSEYQSKSKDIHESQENTKDTQKVQKKKQIISETEGKYYCTYMVDEEGQKVLLNKVPIAQVETQSNLQNTIASHETNSCNHNIVRNARTAFECKQELQMEAAHRKNLHEVMDLIKGNIGIQSNSKKYYSY
ncbi:hypothetical protein [Clostridium uliginosum]|uniref:Uncharacterized protein n=1 Tax=Clostridium uliginosum TaxID=119641 RepID=A0A1I1NWS1_9CLOT|nr:hypothetical protein [Clostridium uliginosum]SFD01866.1 hypothetical protein SAMN05421842_11716 [Clostridium uliginosum]